MQTDTDDKDLPRYFTDCEKLRYKFYEFVAAPTLPKRLLIIYGIDGVGKTLLLKWFRRYCKSVGVKIPVAFMSGNDVKSIPDDVLYLNSEHGWVPDLKAAGILLPTFTKTFEHYRALKAKIEDETPKILAQAVKDGLKIVETPMSLLPNPVYQLVGKLGLYSIEVAIDMLVNRGIKRDEIDLILEHETRLTHDFLADIKLAGDGRRIVLILDTFKKGIMLDDWVCNIAQCLSQMKANVLLVIAGRDRPNWNREWPSWRANAQIEELKPMEEGKMRDLIQRYYAMICKSEPNPMQVEEIIHFAGGLPLFASTAVNVWVSHKFEDFPSFKFELVESLRELLMEGMPKELIPMLEAAAIVRGFDQPILRAVTGIAEVSEMYNELRQYPFVELRAERPALHDKVREVIGENLRVQDSERYCELHERAAAYFAKQLEAVAGDQSEEVEGKEAERLELEHLYHYVCAHEKAGMKLFQEKAEELTRYRLVSKLRILLDDVSTYPLERKDSKLWIEYYKARVDHLEGKLDAAEQKYEAIVNNQDATPKLRAYASCDLGEILARWDRLSRSDGPQRAINALESALEFLSEDENLPPLVQAKLASAYLPLRSVYAFQTNWTEASKCLKEAREFYQKHGDTYGELQVIDRIKADYGFQGMWREMLGIQQEGLELAKPRWSSNSFIKARLLGTMGECWVLAGRCSEAETNLSRSLKILEEKGVFDIRMRFHRDLGYALGMQSRFEEAMDCFAESDKVADQLGKDGEPIEKAYTSIFRGRVLLEQNDLENAQKSLQEAIGHMTNSDPKRMICFSFLGRAHEMMQQWHEAEDSYNKALALRQTIKGQHYFEADARTGLVRVKHAQGDFNGLSKPLAEAEKLAQDYEYNDLLASLRLTQAEQQINDYGTALSLFKQAMTYALRYNRFLLDEILGGRPQGTLLCPIIPFCLRHGEAGQRLLTALRDWWQTDVNDIGIPRPSTISPIPESISLVEAEQIARGYEPGISTIQRSVVDQIDLALSKQGC
jgi:hypothetical protein